MNLIIDIGNTFAKVAVTHGGDIVYSQVFSGPAPADVDGVVAAALRERPGGTIGAAILSTTRHPDPALTSYVEQLVGKVLFFNSSTPTPLTVRYATPHTLGTDRLAAAVGAWSLAPGREIAVFDFGSALTIDRVSASGEFLGGNISPGVRMRFEALHRLTDRLPLVEPPYGDPQPTGNNTRQAIESGVLFGMLGEIEGYISRFREETGEISIFFTGGDHKLFADKVKNTIFAAGDLVIRGLDRILDGNATP